VIKDAESYILDLRNQYFSLEVLLITA